MEEYICKYCGKKYQHTYKKYSIYNNYCSKECAKKHKKELTKPQYRICEHCGKEYWWEDKGHWNKNNEQVHIKGRNNSNEVINSTKYCCYECGKEHLKQKRQTTYMNLTEEEKQLHRDKTIEGIKKRTPEHNKSMIEKRRQTCLEKYGAVSYLSSVEGKAHLKEVNANKTQEEKDKIKEKIRATKLKRYGDEHYIAADKISAVKRKRSQEDPDYYKKISNKSIKTCMERYGVTHYSKTPEAKERNLQKYNSLSPERKKEIVELSKQTMINRYGKDYSKMRAKKAAETCMKKYGMKSILLPQTRHSNRANKSKINESFAKTLETNNIKFEREFGLIRYAYDFKIDNTLIELNPTPTHFSTNTTLWKYQPKAEDYHYNKTLTAVENGYRCIHVWDWDNIEKVLDIFREKKILYARNLTIGEVSKEETDVFLDLYHLQNSCNGQSVRLGLYLGTELVEIMTFGKPRYNKKYEWELLRLCSKKEYSIVGGAERLFKYFIEKYNPVSIVSYCDNSKFTGDVYKRLGMELKLYGKPSKHWYNIITERHITDNLLRMRGYSQLHKDTIHKKGEDNEILMLEDGYLEIYDCGQSTYIWKK